VSIRDRARRYVVADAGVLLTRVNTVKPTPDERVVGVDAGMTDLLRPAMYDAYHPIRNLGAGERATGAMPRHRRPVGNPCHGRRTYL